MNRWSSTDEFQSFIDDGGIVEADDEMSDEYRTEVFKFIELHANSELMGGLTERDWIPRSPGLRRKMGVLAKTQDEIGHAHLLYMVAVDLGVKTRRQMLEDLFAGRSRFHNVFHYAAITWGDQVAIAYLVDAAALISQQAVFKNCSYGPYRRILRRIIAEEGFHMRHGEEMLLTIAEGTQIQHDLFQEALDRWWLPALQLFGPDSKPDDELMRFRIKSEPNEVLRDRWVQKYAPLLTGYGFAIPDPDLRHDPDDRALGDRPDRLVAPQGNPRQRRTRLRPPHRERRPALVRHGVGARRPRRGRPGGGMTVATDLVEAVRAAVATVDDPELPGISIVELGLLERLSADADGAVSIGLIPTFSGCPALSLIGDLVRDAASTVDGVRSVDVTFLSAPAWSVERISERARGQLASGLTVAVERDGRALCPRCGSETIERSMFGPTRCRAVHRCPGCGEAIEVMR